MKKTDTNKKVTKVRNWLGSILMQLSSIVATDIIICKEAK